MRSPHPQARAQLAGVEAANTGAILAEVRVNPIRVQECGAQQPEHDSPRRFHVIGSTGRHLMSKDRGRAR
jgi:hypothetical protein